MVGPGTGAVYLFDRSCLLDVVPGEVYPKPALLGRSAVRAPLVVCQIDPSPGLLAGQLCPLVDSELRIVSSGQISSAPPAVDSLRSAQQWFAGSAVGKVQLRLAVCYPPPRSAGAYMGLATAAQNVAFWQHDQQGMLPADYCSLRVKRAVVSVSNFLQAP